MAIGPAERKIDSQQTEDQPGRFTALQANRAETLRECVQNALTHYLRNLDGYEVKDLHRMVMGEVELPLIETLLDYTQGNQTRVARLLGISRSTLRKKMAYHGIRRDT
ncbi:helix-turn-helix domain-containing protein [Candidatus Thiosymbion oneisti]|uniref:helix-turn-helix domain-containing protein n=1 Tax=Candidatus Thiosymbion oneisti TaxID=589554 RepID=UPI000B7FB5BB|nr:helix-turn-helix domain-containing protein [Candidatus Thiosymbion oneisti]